jgi:hypothetical protein
MGRSPGSASRCGAGSRLCYFAVICRYGTAGWRKCGGGSKIDATAGEVGSAAEVAVGVTVRLLAFTGLVYLAVRLRQGKNWARIALAVLYGGLGTLSLVIGPLTWLTQGGSLADAMAAADLGLYCSRPAGSCTWQRSSHR